jgi:hypothetical protein
MNYNQFVEEHGLEGKKMQVMQAKKSSYGKVGDLVIIFGGTSEKPWSTLTAAEKNAFKKADVTELSENVYVIGGGAQVVGTWTF